MEKIGFSPTELKQIAIQQAERRQRWTDKIRYLNSQLEAGAVQLPPDPEWLLDFYRIKERADGLVDLNTLSADTKVVINAVWDAKQPVAE